MRTIEVQYGYENRVKGGRNMPVTLTIGNRDGTAMKSSVKFLFRQADGERYTHAYPLQPTTGENKQSSYIVLLSMEADALWMRLKNKAGEVTEVQQLDLIQNDGSSELFVGLLSNTPGLFSYLDGVSVNYGRMKTRTFTLSVGNFPEDGRQLDSFDLIAINNYQVSKLSVRQVRVLIQRIRNGGVLLFGTGERVNDTLGMFAPELLDDMYDQPEKRNLPLIAIDGLTVQTPDTENRAETPASLPCVHINLHGGSVTFSTDNNPLITAINKGSGTFAVASIDLTAFRDYASAHTLYTDQLLTRVLGSARLERPASEPYITRYDDD